MRRILSSFDYVYHRFVCFISSRKCQFQYLHITMQRNTPLHGYRGVYSKGVRVTCLSRITHELYTLNPNPNPSSSSQLTPSTNCTHRKGSPSSPHICHPCLLHGAILSSDRLSQNGHEGGWGGWVRGRWVVLAGR